MSRIGIVDLAGVVYSAGKVFDGLSTGRLDTENFLRSGSVAGVASRADLSLLEDLRDAGQYVIDHAGETVDVRFVCAINASITRSGSLHPGRFRTADQRIGVPTRYGRHEPPPVTEGSLQRIIDAATGSGDVRDDAVQLFVALASAQPFGDGNKRSALFAANALLLGANAGLLLTVPVEQASEFNDLLARAYVRGESSGVKDLLRSCGLVALG